MIDFYIKKLVVTGFNVRDAEIDLQRGANIIYGVSDKGKSYVLECIGYMFGAPSMRLSASSGYGVVRMYIATSQGEVTLERHFDTKKDPVSIMSTDPRYTCFNCTGAKIEALDTFWKALIGINEYQTIITNCYYERKQLTWNNIVKFLMIKEDRISKTASIIPASTQVYSALLFLLTGQDFGNEHVLTSDAERRMRAKGVKAYITKKREELQKRQFDLMQQVCADEAQATDESWNTLLFRLSCKEDQLKTAVDRSRELHMKIDSLQKALSSGLLRKESHTLLRDLYDAQRKRLAFSLEGQILDYKHDANRVCPFCQSSITSNVGMNVLEASRAEFAEAEYSLKQFEADTAELDKQIEKLRASLDAAEKECMQVDNDISNSYMPEITELKKALQQHEMLVVTKKELEVVNLDLESIQIEYDSLEVKATDKAVLFKPKEEFPQEFIDAMSHQLMNLLVSCGYTDLEHAYFERATMDASVSFVDKTRFGEGRRAFLNASVAFCLYRYMCDNAVYTPGVLYLDSPTQAIGEPDGSGLTAALLNYIISGSEPGQVILIVNKIPEGVDLSKVNAKDLSAEGFLPDFKPPQRIRKEHIRKENEGEQTAMDSLLQGGNSQETSGGYND